MTAKVIVGSTNPIKIQSAKKGFDAVFPDHVILFEGTNAKSGVADQPVSDPETYTGAFNRALFARSAFPAASFWVGIEGGITDRAGLMEAFAWIVIMGPKGTSRARTASFLLPDAVANLVRNGMELGLADDAVFGRNNSKQQDGAVGLLTNGAIDRTSYYSHAVTLALIPFVQTQLAWPQVSASP